MVSWFARYGRYTKGSKEIRPTIVVVFWKGGVWYDIWDIS